jgi:response regulator RpfG family c-di-GMP phosphodiesterase
MKASSSPGTAATLLLVDDEENILGAVRMLGATATAFSRRPARTTRLTCSGATTCKSSFPISVCRAQRHRLLSKVKEMYPDTVRMVLSGYTDLAAVTAAINQGAIYKFLTKPWNDEELRLQIRDAFRIARRPRESRSSGAPA